MTTTHESVAEELAMLRESLRALDDHVTRRDWAGYDPRDALRSPLLGRLPGRWARIAATQVLLRLPFNPRRLLGYGPAHDPKALSLFARAYLRGMDDADPEARAAARERLALVADHLAARPDVVARGPFGWGYPFPWQSRHLFVPAHSPNAVCTAYAGEALLELATGEAALGMPPISRAAAAAVPDAVRSMARRFAMQNAMYALRRHPRRRVGEAIVFHYTQFDTNEIFNASLLLAAFLARVAAVRAAPSDDGAGAAAADAWRTADEHAMAASDAPTRTALAAPWLGGRLEAECWDVAARAARFALTHQQADGAWAYGTGDRQRWRDSFHTGYNLLALAALRADLAATRALADALPEWNRASAVDDLLRDLDDAIARGFDDYRRRFFAPEAPASYFEGGRGPLDAHAVAHAALTLAAFGDDDGARDQLLRLIATMQSPDDGHFAYQAHGVGGGRINRVEYMRWTQAWVMWALSAVLAFSGANDDEASPSTAPGAARA